MLLLATILLILALAAFVLAAVGVVTRLHLVPLGLALATLSVLVLVLAELPDPPEPPVDEMTWHVSASAGNDANNCEQAEAPTGPKRTLIAGLACIGEAGTENGAGKTLKVAAGHYPESLIDRIPSGSGPEAPFTLMCERDFECINGQAASTAGASFPATPPLFGRQRTTALAQIGFNRPSHWITIRGFVFEGGGGTYLSGSTANTHHDITFTNNEFRNAPNGMGIQASAAANIAVIGNRMFGLGLTCDGHPGLCHAIYAADLTSGWVIRDNDIHDNAAYGIHLYGTTDLPANFVIEANRTYRNGTLNQNGAGIIVYGDGHQILNNLSYSNIYEGVLMRGVSNTMAGNNTTYSNGGPGINRESGVSTTCTNNLSVRDAGEINCDVETGNVEVGAPQRQR
jgi:hypothetical protein